MQKFVNNYSQPITAAIGAAATSVTTAFAVPGMATGDTAVLTLSDPNGSDVEIIGVTKTVAGYDLARGLEGTAAREWPVDSVVSMRITAALLAELTAIFGAATPGRVPASGGGSTNFLRADGQWAAPAPQANVWEGAVLKTSADAVSNVNGGPMWVINIASITASVVIIQTSNVNHISITAPSSSQTPIRKRMRVVVQASSQANIAVTLNGVHHSNWSNLDVSYEEYPFALDFDFLISSNLRVASLKDYGYAVV